MPGRTIAIGDIHGCSMALAVLLNSVVPGPDDTLVTLGDYIDRGPDSRGVCAWRRKSPCSAFKASSWSPAST
jgi:hypothetical protein